MKVLLQLVIQGRLILNVILSHLIRSLWGLNRLLGYQFKLIVSLANTNGVIAYRKHEFLVIEWRN